MIIKNYKIENTFRQILFQSPELKNNDWFMWQYANFRDLEDPEHRIGNRLLYIPEKKITDYSTHKTDLYYLDFDDRNLRHFYLIKSDRNDR